MRKIIAAVGAALLLTGCSMSVADDEDVKAASEEHDQASPEANDRGNMPKQIGEEAGRTGCAEDGGVCLTFKVTAIEPINECTEPYSQASFNGQGVRVDLEVKTLGIAQENMAAVGDTFNPNNWQWLLDDGTTESFSSQSSVDNAAYGCVARAGFLDSMSPNSEYKGSLAFDIPENATTLILRPNTSPGGWEWELPDLGDASDTETKDEGDSAAGEQSAAPQPNRQQNAPAATYTPQAGPTLPLDALDAAIERNNAPYEPAPDYYEPPAPAPAPEPALAPEVYEPAPALPDGAGGGQAGY